MRIIIVWFLMIWGSVVFGLGLMESGYLRDTSGLPVSGNVSMQFMIYDNLSGGSSLWTSEVKTVTVSEGLYQVVLTENILGFQLPFTPTASYFMEQWVNAQVLSPRKPISAGLFSAYAAYANSAGLAQIANLAISMNASGLTGAMVVSNGNVGIGTTAPSTKLDVGGTVSASALQVNGDYSTKYGQSVKWGNVPVFTYDSNDNLLVKGNSLRTTLVISSNGDVGIGTTAPGTKLEVAGTISASAIQVNGDANFKSGIVYGGRQNTGYFFNVAAISNVMDLLQFHDGNGHTLINAYKNNGGEIGLWNLSNDKTIQLLGSNGNANFAGTVSANRFVGDGSMLTGVNSSQWINTNGNISFSNGNVGIGTTAPTEKLSVVGSVSVNGQYLHFQNSTQPYIYLTDANSTSYGGVFGIATAANNHTNGSAPKDLVLRNESGIKFSADNGASSAMTISSNGNVGIGTTVPSTKLEVAGTISASALQINDPSTLHNVNVVGASNIAPLTIYHPNGNTNGYYTGIQFSGETPKAGIFFKSNGIGYARGDLQFAISANNGYGGVSPSDALMTIKENGNVGIGTTVPSTKLEVAGTVSADVFSVAPGISGLKINATPTTYFNIGAQNYITNPDLRIIVNGTNELARMDANGNFRLGTNDMSPITSRLEVNGTVSASALQVNATSILHNVNVVGASNIAPVTIYHPNGNTNGYYTGIQFSGETPKAGIFFKSNGIGYARGDLQFAISANNGYGGVSPSDALMTIKENGNVGIGTTLPVSKLQINDTAGSIYGNILLNSSGVDSVPNIRIANDAQAWWMGVAGDNNDAFTIGSGSYNDSTAYRRVTVKTDGNVGIGTTAPSEKLSVVGNILASDGNNISGIYPQGPSGTYIGTVTNTDLRLGANNGTKMYIRPSGLVEVLGTVSANRYVGDGSMLTGVNSSQWINTNGNISFSNGNVGIGTTAPSTKLEVAGTVSASAIQVNGTGTFSKTTAGTYEALRLFSSSTSGQPYISLSNTGLGGSPMTYLVGGSPDNGGHSIFKLYMSNNSGGGILFMDGDGEVSGAGYMRFLSGTGKELAKFGYTSDFMGVFTGIKLSADTYSASTKDATTYQHGSIHTDGGIGVAKSISVAGTLNSTFTGVNSFAGTISASALNIAGATSIGGSANFGANIGLANGSYLNWGADTNLFRGAADTLRTDDSLLIGRYLQVIGNGAPSSIGIASYYGSNIAVFDNSVGVDAYPTIMIDGINHMLRFGTGGSSNLDVNLYRSAANKLKTDSSFEVGGTVSASALQVNGKVSGVGSLEMTGRLTNAGGDILAYNTGENQFTADSYAQTQRSGMLFKQAGTFAARIQTLPYSSGLVFNVGTDEADVVISANGNVGIGTTRPEYKLTVEGTIGAREVLVTQRAWADFVFDHDYQLMPIRELERYVKLYQHLPNIPTTAEVLKSGVSIGEMQARLLQKIEELTLYVIDLQHQIDELKKAR